MAKVSKKMKASMDAVDRTKEYVLAEAAALVKQNAAGTKFDETIEIAMNLGVDPRHADQMVLRRCCHAERHWEEHACGGFCKGCQG